MAFDNFDHDALAVANTGLVFSGTGGLTVHATLASSLRAGAIAQTLEGKKSGKWYVEWTCNTASGQVDGVGIVDSRGVYGGAFMGDDGFGFELGWGYYTNGHVAHHNTTVVSTSTWGNGDVIGCAIDLDNARLWWRVNGGGWVGTTGTPDPATNTNGFDISTMLAHGLRVYPAVNLSGSSANFTVNFGASAYAHTAPSGFGGWTNVGEAAGYFGSYASTNQGGNFEINILGGDTLVSAYVATLSGACTKIVFGIAQSNNQPLKCVIYADNSNSPVGGALLATSTNTITQATYGEFVFLFSGFSFVSGTKYWIGLNNSDTGNSHVGGPALAGGLKYYTTATAGVPDAIFPSGPSSADYRYQMLAYVSSAVEADGAIGTITMSAPAATGEAAGNAQGALATITMSAPAGSAAEVIRAQGDIGTIKLRAPKYGPPGEPPTFATQVVRQVIGEGPLPAARATQIVRQTIGAINPGTRATQVVRQIIADAIPCATKWCQCWRIFRLDGVVMRFTSLDEDFEWGNDIYDTCGGLTPSAAESASTVGQVGNIELAGIISSDKITEEDLYGGVYDDAFVEVWLVPYEVTAGEVPRRLAAGWTGNLTHTANNFNMEVTGPGARLDQQALTEVVTPTCRWVFGDSRCTIDLEALKKASIVSAAIDRGQFLADISEGSEGAGMFSGEGDPGSGTEDGIQWANGRARWTTGRNTGQTTEVKTVDFTTGKIVLWKLPSYLPVPGDEFDLLPGCAQDAHTCQFVYNNYLNFGGFRDVPGDDSIDATPDAKY